MRSYTQYALTALMAVMILFSGHVMAAEPLTGSAGAVSMTAYVKVILGLAFVLGLFLLSTFLFKRFGNGPMLAKGELKVIDGLHISNKERLVLVELKGRQILLAITPGQITKLDTLYNDIDTSVSASPDYELVQARAAENSAG